MEGSQCTFIHQLKKVKEVPQIVSNKFIINLLCYKEFFGWSNDILLCACYLPPQGSTCYDNETDGIELLNKSLLTVTAKYPGVHLIVAGDSNARTGDEIDYIKDDEALYLSGGNFYSVSHFDIPRKSQDKEINAFGQNLLEMCKAHDTHIVNGRSLSDKDGHMTFATSTSLIDYFVISSELFSVVKICLF